MPKLPIEYESNLEDGMKTAARLENTIPENIDDAAQIIANSWIREAQRTMQKNGSVVTGTGLRSFSTTSGGTGKELVFGAAYLQELDSGTTPHFPDTDNPRFIAAARSYGMDRQQLASIIARKGTRPHPWINETTAKIRRSAPERTKIKLRDAAQESLTNIG